MTELQIDAVRDEVSIFLGNIIPDYHDRHEVLDLILDDVVAAIEETADWSDLEDDEVCLGDIHIAFGRVIKKHLNKKQKVYLLITQWSVDYEQGSNSGVYATKELAQKEMKRDYKNMCEEYPDWVGSIDDNCAEMQEEGDYTRNHCDWQIKEIEVISE